MAALIQPLVTSPEISEKDIPALPNGGLLRYIRSQISAAGESFHVLDLDTVGGLMERWNRAFPSVQPYYAVKCNPNPSLVAALAALSANFDCASHKEIEDVLSLGVHPDRIIFANPCKPESHLQYARQVGVHFTTYDSVYEVQKISKWHPKCELLLRVKAPDESTAKWKLGAKFGALPREIKPLLEAARLADLTVLGVCFHVGTNVKCARAYESAIALSRSVFDTAAQLGLPKLKVLDIGGGFTPGPDFETTAQAINWAVKAHFSNEPDLTVIAEPGRYFAATCFTNATRIIGKRVRGQLREYFVGEGTHGSFHYYGHEGLTPIPMAATSNPTCTGMRTYPSTVFGPTCDATDVLVVDCQLPELEVNDWLVFKDLGAYTSAMGTNFNGFRTSEIPTHVARCSDFL